MPMTEQAAIALEESIAHWERNVAGQRVRFGADECALCSLFNDNGDCPGCPVSARTGIGMCVRTPYKEACDAHYKNNARKFQQLAEAELDFLKSLRDPPASPETAPSEALK